MRTVKSDKFISEEAIEHSATKLISKDSIAVVTRVGVGKIAIIPYNFATSQDFLNFSDLNINLDFAGFLLYRVMAREADKAQGTSIKGITKSTLLSIVVSVPRLKEEQLKIGMLLKNTDSLIAANEDKHKNALNIRRRFITSILS